MLCCADELKPAAVTLLNVGAGQAQSPLLVRQNYGRGKTMILATGGTFTCVSAVRSSNPASPAASWVR